MKLSGDTSAGSQANPEQKEGLSGFWILLCIGGRARVSFLMPGSGIAWYLSFLIVVTNYHKPGGLNTRNFFSDISGG